MTVVQKQPWSLRQLIPSLLLLPVTVIFWKHFGFDSPWEALRIIGIVLTVSYVYFVLIRWVTSIRPVLDVQVSLQEKLLRRLGWILPYKIFAGRVFFLSAIETWIVLQILGWVVQVHNAAVAMASMATTFFGIILLHVYTERHAIRRVAYGE